MNGGSAITPLLRIEPSERSSVERAHVHRIRWLRAAHEGHTDSCTDSWSQHMNGDEQAEENVLRVPRRKEVGDSDPAGTIYLGAISVA